MIEATIVLFPMPQRHDSSTFVSSLNAAEISIGSAHIQPFCVQAHDDLESGDFIHSDSALIK